MVLLGRFIDHRTLAAIASNGSASFAHGLPAAPDFVIIAGFTSATVASGASALPSWQADATNVSLFGTGVGGNVIAVTSVVAHSIIR